MRAVTVSKRDFCYLYLTCKDSEEAHKISTTLLQKRLVACAKQVQITSNYLWEGKIEHSKEVLLIMESALSLFDEIEDKVAKLHSYDTFVLEALPVNKVSQIAQEWMDKELMP